MSHFAGVDTIVVRRAVVEDAEDLEAMRWRLKTEDLAGPTSLDQFVSESAAWFADNLMSAWVAWVAERSGQLRGQVFMHLTEKVPAPFANSTALGYVTNFYVSPEVRNRGIGGRLLAELRNYAEAERLDTLIVWPSERSVPAYKRAGFSGATDILEMPLFPS